MLSQFYTFSIVRPFCSELFSTTLLLQGCNHVLCFGGDGQLSRAPLTANNGTTPYRSSKYRGLSSFTVNGMLLLLLIFGKITVDWAEGAKIGSWVHKNPQSYIGDIVGYTGGTSPALAMPLILCMIIHASVPCCSISTGIRHSGTSSYFQCLSLAQICNSSILV